MYLRESSITKLRKANLIQPAELQFLMIFKLITEEFSYLRANMDALDEYNRNMNEQILGIVNENEWLMDQYDIK